jgi:transcriptional regulator with XRE-family HTH domain
MTQWYGGDLTVDEETPSSRLATRLRELRLGAWDRPITQRRLAEAIGVAVPSVSSWENVSNPTVPPEDRLKAYALFFASPRSLHGLPAESDLTAEEEQRRRGLIDELVRLREEALHHPERRAPRTGALGGRFWYFPDDNPIRIIGSRLSRRALTSPSVNAAQDLLKTEDYEPDRDPLAYASPWHPNYVESLWDGDTDATLELFGHIRAENPTADVRFLTGDAVEKDAVTGHVVILGNGAEFGTVTSTLDWMRRRLELPVATALHDGGDDEYDTVHEVSTDDEGNPRYGGPRKESFRPVFLRAETPDGPRRVTVEGYPQLEYDVALLARLRNPLNLSATVTICSGIFSRGTYGAVRALTDASLRTRNEHYIRDHLDPDNFWMLIHVPVIQTADGAETLTPDLARPFHRLRSSAD